MNFKFSIIIFLSLSLSLCMHACIARHLPLIRKGLVPKLHFSAKMVKVSFDSTPQEVTNEDINSMVLERSDHEDTGANIPQAKDSHKDMKYTQEEEENSGSEIDESISQKKMDKSTSHVGLSRTTQVLEGLKSRASHEKEEDINWRYNSAVKEGVMEMDYEPPQRKTPIHNK